MRLYPLALGFWMAFLALAVGVGALRDGVLRPRLGELRADQVAALLVGLVVLALSALFAAATRPTARQAIAVGVLWAVLTAAFQFTVFHIVLGHPWAVVLADYDLARGRLWSLVVLAQLLGPWLLARRAS